MKLFGSPKDKVVHVKVTNDTLPVNVQIITAPAPAPLMKPETDAVDYELALKVAAVSALIINSMLAIMGYVDFTGHLETLGISTNEIDLGLPTLLFQGYLAVVLAAFTSAADSFPWGTLAVILIPSIIFYYPVSRVFASRNRIDKGLFCLVLTMCLMMISAIPTVGLKRGQDSAYTAFEKQNPIDGTKVIRGLKTEKTIITKEGPTVTGDTVFASTLYTYVLQGPKLYKIANRDNHIVSVTKIEPVLRSKPTPKEDSSNVPGAGS